MPSCQSGQSEWAHIPCPSWARRFESCRRYNKNICGVEQLVARWAHNPEVVKNGSNPTPATNNCSNCNGLLRILSERHRFDSCTPHQVYIGGWCSGSTLKNTHAGFLSYDLLAQLAEHIPFKDGVLGSSPRGITDK